MDTNLILLVDDDPDDLLLLKEAIIELDYRFKFQEAADGRHGINYLRAIPTPDQYPCLVVLDINMPVLDGREMLAILKSDPSLKEIPVVVFTTSSNPSDILYCKQFNVELVTKPFDVSQLMQAAHKIIACCHGNN
jgi:CheY-like chemotaxis protein